MRKLQLNRETLLPLFDDEARRVAAGLMGPATGGCPSHVGLTCILTYNQTCECTLGCHQS